MEPFSGSEIGDRKSGPAKTLSISAVSSTVRAIGPSTAKLFHPDSLGQLGTRPTEGRKPTTLQKFVGFRRDPPKSLPSAKGSIRQATDTAPPPLLPPHVLLKS